MATRRKKKTKRGEDTPKRKAKAIRRRVPAPSRAKRAPRAKRVPAKRAQRAKRPAPAARKKAKKPVAKRRAKKVAAPAKKRAKKVASTAKKRVKKVAAPAKKRVKKAAPAPKKRAKKPAKKKAKKPAKVPPKKPIRKPAKKPAKVPPKKRKKGEAKAPPPSKRQPQFPKPVSKAGYERVDVLGRVRHDADALEQKRAKAYGKPVAAAARRMDEALAFVSTNLVMEGWTAKVHVHPNADKTVDADISIEIPPGKATRVGLIEVGGLLGRLNEHLAQVIHQKIPDAWMQLGFYLPAESQIQVRDERRPYKRYQGALRFGYSYQKVTKLEGLLPQLINAAKATMEGILTNHTRPPTGMYVRATWSKDGQLHRRR